MNATDKSDTTDATGVLRLPPAVPVTYDRNLIRTAVCELRFPELPNIERSALSALRHNIRQEYPHSDTGSSVSVSPARGGVPEVAGGAPIYSFQSRKRDWTFVATVSSLRLETNHYHSFEDFAPRLEKILAWTSEFRDSDFFTRVGLRYINVVPLRDGNLDQWINRALVLPLVEGVFGTPARYVQEVGGLATPGQYLFRHALLPDAGGQDAGTPGYALDFDFFDEMVQLEKVMPLVHDLHAQSYAFFSWAIGERTRQFLGPGRPKARSAREGGR